MVEIKLNCLDVNQGFLVQQVNCQGVMGAGLALQIRNKYPIVYEKYKAVCNKFKPEELLGKVQIIQIHEKFWVVLFYSQLNYGTNKCQTDYDAFERCLYKLKNKIAEKYPINIPIHFPHKIGCGLAGGDWDIISELIYIHIGCRLHTYICKI